MDKQRISPSAGMDGDQQRELNPAQVTAADLANQDINAKRQEYLFAIPSILHHCTRLLKDERDIPALYLVFNIVLIVVPAVVLLHSFHISHLLGAVYLLANYVLFLQRFLLTLHYTQHRRMFHKGAGLGKYIRIFICNLKVLPLANRLLKMCCLNQGQLLCNDLPMKCMKCLCP